MRLFNKKPSILPLLLGLFFLTASQKAHSTDCNENGIEDAADLEPQDYFIFNVPTTMFPEGTGYFILSLDLDGDRRLDLATPSGVFYNEGAQSFLQKGFQLPADEPWSIVSADFNRDGRPEERGAKEAKSNGPAVVSLTEP